MTFRLAIALLATLFLALTTHANWTHFRGSHSTGVAAEAVPQEFGEGKNIAWKVELPGRGLSSPIVVGDKVFLTASNSDKLFVLAYDAKTGKRLWERSFWGTGPTASHPKTCMAAPTPASDGQRIVALFATDDLVCLDLDGNVQWIRSLYEENQGATDGRGLASSLLIVANTVIVQVDTQNLAFAAGIDIATGQNRWRTERAKEISWSTPIAIPGRTPEEKLALLQGAKKLAAVEPLTGKEVWSLEMECDPIASSVLAGNILYVPGGTNDKGEGKGLAAFELQGGSPPKQLWQQRRITPTTASPLVLGDRLYFVQHSQLRAANAKTGEEAGALRLGGEMSSSPVAAGGVLYCFDELGTGFVVQPGDKVEKILHKAKLEESILCTPALANGAMFIRSDKHLWKIAKSS